MAKGALKGFYNSAAWQTLRKQALKRDCFTCQICKSRATEVHHLIELNEENFKDKNISLNLNNLQSLCHFCHNKITKAEQSNSYDCDSKYFFNERGELTPRV